MYDLSYIPTTWHVPSVSTPRHRTFMVGKKDCSQRENRSFKVGNLIVRCSQQMLDQHRKSKKVLIFNSNLLNHINNLGHYI
jgi:hypothetical protein